MNSLPLVSIITPVYNSEKFVEDTIKSVISQTYLNWEHILVDDCSTDASVEIIEKYSSKDPRIKIFKFNENRGSGATRNFAIDNAKGVYIAFLDSDDLWHSQKLERHIAFMIQNNAVLSHTAYDIIDITGKSISTYHPYKKEVTYDMLLRKNDIGCLTAIMKVDVIGKLYMPTLKTKQDYALWLDILKRGYVSVPFDEILAYYRIHNGSATSNKIKLIPKHFKFLRQQIGLGNIKSAYYTFTWIWNGLFKYYL